MSTRILVICGDAWHPAKDVQRGLFPLQKSGFDFEFLENTASQPVSDLTGFSMVVLAKANMNSAADQRPWMNADWERAFFDFVHGGGGLVIVHAGTSRYERLPMMHRLIGGAFLHHPASCFVTLEPVCSHPLTNDTEKFVVHDEHYFMAMADSEAEIFLRSHSGHGTQPAGWTRVEGNGRLCVLTPGHSPEVWLHPQYQRLLLNVFRWTAKLN
ncbi:MAG TPA: ThuA domain-containing protein [Verrucomicrobiae bacterium]